MDKYSYISLALIFFSVITIILGIIYVHTYPGKIAKQRGHPQAKAIEVTSLLGLLVFPLWMFALIWAYSDAVLGIIPDKNRQRGSAKTDSGETAAASAKSEAGKEAPKTP